MISRLHIFLSLFAIGVFCSFNSNAQNHQWSFNIGGGANDFGNVVYTDNKGFVYVVGYFTGSSVDFDPSPAGTAYLSSNGSNKDGYVAKYTAAGQYVWAFSIGGTDLDDVQNVTTDAAGNVYITGYFRGQGVDFDPSATGSALLNSNGEAGGDPGYGGDIFLAKYTSAGNYVWAFNVGGSLLGDNGRNIGCDNNGNVCMSGYFRETPDFDPSAAGVHTLDASSGTLFVAKYDTNGNYLWAFNVGEGNVDNAPFGMKTDATGNIYLTGYFQGVNKDFDPSSTGSALLSSQGGFDVFVAKYTSAGNYAWAFAIGGPNADVGRDIEIDNVGNVYVAGDFDGSNIDFDPSASTANLSSNNRDVFIAKYNNNGQYQWAKRFGAAGVDISWSVAYSKSNIYITGSFQGTMNFNPGPIPDNLVSSGGNDFFMTKFDVNGNYVCAFKVGGTDNDDAYTIDADTSGYLYTTGILSSYNTDFNPGAGTNNLSTNGAADVFVAKYIWPDNPKPAGTLTGSTICPGQQATLTFTATSGTGPFTIEYSNGTTVYTQTNVQSGVPFNLSPSPTVTTTYTLISIRDATVCPSTNNVAGITAVVTVSGGGSTDFTYKQSPCSPKTIQFFATSTGATYSWNFGNGTTSTGNPNPTVTYANYGNYTVHLVVGNGGGCADSAIKTIPVFLAQSNIVFNKDTAVCPGTKLQLATDSGVVFCWKPEVTISNTAISNTTVSPSVATTYFLTSQIPGSNLVVNGNFSAGNSGFTSDYAAASPNTTEGQYWIGTNPVAWNSSLGNCTDHTSGTGNMLLVNGSPTVAAKLWSQTVNIVPNTNYAFSVWLQSLYSVNPASLRFSINGRVMGDNILAGATTCQWKQFYVTWNSGNVTAANLSIINNNTIVQGNDFAIDDISFATVTMRYDSLKVSIAPNPQIKGFGDTTICKGIPVQLNASGGNVYSWSPLTTLSNGVIANPIANPTVSTDYIVSGYLQPGCVGHDTVRIIILPSPSVNVTPSASACAGAPFQLNASGGSVYSWTPSTGLNSDNISNPVDTSWFSITHYVTVTSSQGCKAVDSVSIIRVPKPQVSTRPDTSFCKGGSVILNTSISNQTGFSWSPATGLSNANTLNPSASPNDTTQYIITATNGTCVTKDTVIVNVKPKPIVTLNNDTAFCKGISLSLNATGGGTYQWFPTTGLSSSGVYNPVATADTTTTYFVTVTGSNGCSSKDSVKITIYQKPKILTRPDTSFCKGGSVILNTSITNQTGFSWSPTTGMSNANTLNPSASPNDTTQYIITATNGTCVTKDTVMVNVKPRPLVTLNNDTAFCKGISLQLTATGGGTYQWTPSTGLSSSGVYNPVATADTTTTYFVTVTGSNGCASKDSVKITIYQKPKILTRPDTSFCKGGSVILNTSITNQTGFSWSPATGLSNANTLNPSASPNDTTQYIITATNGTCVTKDTVVVNVKPKPVVTLNKDTAFCKGISLQLNATGGGTYQWTPSTGLSSSGVYNPVATADTTTTYFVTVTGSNGCASKDSVKMTIYPLPFVRTIPNDSFCKGSSLILSTSASPGASYSWFPKTGLNDSTLQNPAANPLVQTQYIVTVKTAKNCVAKDTVTVTPLALPIISRTADTSICKGAKANLYASGGVSYLWIPATGLSDPHISNPVSSSDTDMLYKVWVTDKFGCKNLDSVKLIVHPPLRGFGLTPAFTKICHSDTLVLAASGADFYQWISGTNILSPDSAKTYIVPSTSGTYQVRVTDTVCHIVDTLMSTVVISAPPAVVVKKSNDIDCKFSNAQLQASGGIIYRWTPPTGLSDTASQNPVASPTVSTNYTVNVMDSSGCTNMQSVKVYVNYGLNTSAHQVPDAFTPNGDGLNDCFGLKTWGSLEQLDFSIYNRWGQVVFHTANETDCWDGKLNGIQQQTGAFVYIIRAKAVCGGDIFKKGTVLLIR